MLSFCFAIKSSMVLERLLTDFIALLLSTIVRYLFYLIFSCSKFNLSFSDISFCMLSKYWLQSWSLFLSPYDIYYPPIPSSPHSPPPTSLPISSILAAAPIFPLLLSASHLLLLKDSAPIESLGFDGAICRSVTDSWRNLLVMACCLCLLSSS